MATLGTTITPGISPLRDIEAQGASVGDTAYDANGNLLRWTGESWTMEGGGGGAATLPSFNFNWEQARSDAMTQLTPYYEQKLKEAGGDVERAKRLIEEDYKVGKRIASEDYATTVQQAEEDTATAQQTFNLDKAEELRDVTGKLNQRGVLTGQIPLGSTQSAAPVSGYAQDWYLNPMGQRQNLRQLAIERALQRQKEAAGLQQVRSNEALDLSRQRGIEEQDVQYPRTQRALEEEKREKAINQMVPMKYEEEYSKFRAANPTY